MQYSNVYLNQISEFIHCYLSYSHKPVLTERKSNIFSMIHQRNNQTMGNNKLEKDKSVQSEFPKKFYVCSDMHLLQHY